MGERAVVIVVIGGGDLSSRAVELVEAVAPTAVIAADSGLDVALSAGLVPTALVGDLDSLSASGRMWAYAHHVPIEEHAADKDLTDTELALAHAVRHTGDTSGDLLVVGGIGDELDRLDHLLGTLQALGHPTLAAFDSITAVLGTAEVHVVHAGHSIAPPLEAGRTFSLVALHGACTGVDVTGARWTLTDATFTGHEARGLSNISDGTPHVSVGQGVLTMVIP